MAIVSVHQAVSLYLKSSKVVIWGASSSGLRVLGNLKFFFDIKSKPHFFYDSNIKLHGEVIDGLDVISYQEFTEIMKEDGVLCIVASSIVSEIKKELIELGFENWVFAHGLIYTDKIFAKYDRQFIKLYDNIRGISNMDSDECYSLYSLAKASSQIPGAYAEVGVYKGGSGFLAASQLKDRRCYLFDTFEGLPPDLSNISSPKENWLNETNVDTVKSLIASSGLNDGNLKICKGYFPDETKHHVPNGEKFCLVHLDTDLYISTKNALEFFFPKLSVGGRILIHDYNCVGCPGVKLAVDEFVNEKNIYSNLIQLCESQALITKF